MLYFRIRDNSLYKTLLTFVISICFFLNADNVTDRSQLVQSAAAHPGGHQTGCSSSSPDVRGKIALLSCEHPPKCTCVTLSTVLMGSEHSINCVLIHNPTFQFWNTIHSLKQTFISLNRVSLHLNPFIYFFCSCQFLPTCHAHSTYFLFKQ